MNKFDDTKLYVLLIENDFDKIYSFLKTYGLDSVDRDGRTFLMSAVVESKIDLVKYLLGIGCDVNISDKNGLTPLHFAAIHNRKDIAEILIARGAKIDFEDSQGNTPLWRAAMENDAESPVIKYLIRLGSDINHKNRHGVSVKNLL